MTRRSLRAPLRRTVAALALSATAVTGLVACGNDDDGAEPAAASSGSPTTTGPVDAVELASAMTAAYEDVTSARVSLSVEGVPGGGEVSGEGVVSYGGAEDGAGPAVSMTMDAMGQSVELRVVDGVVYVGGPLAAMLGGGSPWVGLDLSTVDLGALGIDPDQLTGSFDPEQLAATLGSAADIERDGEETVDGETLQRYTVTLDPSALAELVPDAAEALPTEPVEQTVLLDDADRLRELTMDLPLPTGETATLTVRMWDYGTDVTVEAPPAADVTLLDGIPGFTTS
ncbi:LppX_LprAFG lipoprotein [Nocardioides zeae]|uniref:LppX_LprAFG lipoprotein n=1 Tax=Nocardioides zeae TaxID=1457234 RepID=A0A6P0HEX9_9ACTN|nr:LppX_LprAFG lipoprotein [Nocardioides zeae]NEN77171.1 LppX_LprAFG lipoprotein [Nocardioides zeae]